MINGSLNGTIMRQPVVVYIGTIHGSRPLRWPSSRRADVTFHPRIPPAIRLLSIVILHEQVQCNNFNIIIIFSPVVLHRNTMGMSYLYPKSVIRHYITGFITIYKQQNASIGRVTWTVRLKRFKCNIDSSTPDQE